MSTSLCKSLPFEASCFQNANAQPTEVQPTSQNLFAHSGMTIQNKYTNNQAYDQDP